MKNEGPFIQICKGDGVPEWYPIDFAIGISRGQRVLYKKDQLPKELYLYCGKSREAKKSLVYRGRFRMSRKKPALGGLGDIAAAALVLLFAAIGVVSVFAPLADAMM